MKEGIHPGPRLELNIRLFYIFQAKRALLGPFLLEDPE
jgi:hypothetical protein